MTRTPVARPSVLAVSLLLIVVALQPRSAFAQVPSYYGGVQHGRGTWYGVPPMRKFRLAITPASLHDVHRP